MPESNAAPLEKYLHELQGGLRSLPAEEAREIVEEIRSHVYEAASPSGQPNSAAMQATLERFGPARELASKYVMQSMAARVHASGSHFLALKTIYRWARLSLAGFGAFIVTVVGYATAAVFAYAALAKPFMPHRVGLWKVPDPSDPFSFSWGVVDRPDARELLGWWIIPIGLALASAFFFLTQRFVMWVVRRLRASSTGIATMHKEQP